ncbi:MAG: hypothetical protein IPL86_16040 [Flavobacteriales bacterium]|nr:hypothetical protein [Flavobacteriales bacterium]
MHIDQERLKEVLARGLDHGEHGIDEEKACVMEAAAYVAGEPWSDAPQCVCPVIGEMMREWNDGIGGVVERTALLGPLISVIVGSASTPDVQVRRAAMLMDWAIRVSLPMRLRAAGHESAARELEALPPIEVDAPFAAEDYSRTLAHADSKNERYGERSLAEQAAMSGANVMVHEDDTIAAFWGVTGDTNRIALHCHCDGDDECKTTAAIDASAVDLIKRLVSVS